MDNAKAWVLGALKSWTIYFGALLVALPDLVPLLAPDLQALFPPAQYDRLMRILGMIVILLRVKTTVSLAVKGGGAQSGRASLDLLLVLAAASLCAACAGGPRAKAPQSLPEQIEAANVLMEQISGRLVTLSCTQFDSTGNFCIEPGKPLMPIDSLELHERFIEKPHMALLTVSALGPGEVADCLGTPRNANACVAAVNNLLLEADRYLIDLAARQGVK